MADTDKNVALRHAAKFHLLINPNYFGNLGALDLPDLPKPVLKKIGDTTFEEMTGEVHRPPHRAEVQHDL